MYLETLSFDVIFQLTLQHLKLVVSACLIAFLLALSIGIWVTRPHLNGKWVPKIVTQFLFLGQAVPSLAIIGLVMALLGTGAPTAIFALTLGSLVPMLRNVIVGLKGVSEPVLDAARGNGMSPLTVLWKVELPLALPAIFAGIRTAVVIAIGTAALSSQIGAGGLGSLIFTGMAMFDMPLMLAGAIPTALLAVGADRFLGAAETHFRGKW